MALSLPADSKVELKHKFLQNIRVTSDGVIESRPRLQDFLVLTGSIDLVHSIRKLIDKSGSDTNYIVGAGTKIFTGDVTPLTQKATGFSGKPLSIVNFRPEEAIETYAYIADEDKMVKISVSDVLAEIGITAPTKSIVYELDGPYRKTLDNVTAATEPDWVVTNGAKSVVSRVNTTISQVVADGALPDFVSIIPTAFTLGIQPGAQLTINGNEETVESVLNTGLAAGIATIAAIVYEAGTTGICHITLSIPVTEIYRNSILLLNGTEYVRVLEVTRGNDGIPVIKTSTTGTFAVGNTVQGIASFRIYTNNVYAATNTIVADAVRDAVAAAGISTLTKTANYDLTNAGGKPLSENAIFHISLRVSDLAKIAEIQVQLWLDTGGIDYLYYPISPNFLAANTSQQAGIAVTLQSALQRTDLINTAYNERYTSRQMMRDIDYESYSPYGYSQYDLGEPYQIGNVTTFETALGNQAWTEIAVPFNKFTKVGSDSSKSRKDIKAIRISINATDVVNVDFDSIWIGGASGLDSIGSSEQVLFPYNYVYRFRDPATKAVSNWSPPLREGLLLRRNGVTISIPTNSIPNTYKVDIARIGGQLNDFRVLSSIFNDGSTFTDNLSDDLIADNDKITRASTEFSVGDFDYFKPFAILDKPKSGTCNVVGTEFTRLLGDTLDTSYPRGTQILVNNRLTKFYSNPTSTSKVSLEDNLETLTNVKWEIREPLLTGQPLPIIAGPHKGVIFGAGDVNAAGTVYFTDPNSPDTQSDVNKIEISTPTEPIMAIVIYDSLPLVYTTQRSYSLNAFNNNGYLDFDPRENANSRGIISRFGVCVARSFVYQLTGDGIIRSEGIGNPQSITDGDLHSLFPHNGIEPQTIIFHGISVYPPDFTKPEEMRLFSTEDHIFWRFLDTNNKYACFVYDTRLEGWISFDTFVGNIIGAIYKEEEEGNVDILAGQEGMVAKYGNTTSDEDGLISIVAPFTDDLGDFRSLKQFYDVAIDAVAGDSNIGIALTNKLYFNNLDISIPAVTFPDDTNRDILIQNLNNGLGQIARNMTQLLSWSLDAGVKLYKESIDYIPYDTEIITDKAKEFGDEEIVDKFWQGIVIDGDTFGVDKILRFYNDAGVEKASIKINHNGKIRKLYTFDVPFFSHRIRRSSTDGIEWIPYREDYTFDTDFDENKKYFNGIVLDIDTGGVDRTLKVYDDNHILRATIVVNHNGRYEEEFSFDTPFLSFEARKEFTAVVGLTKLALYTEEYRMAAFVDDINDNEPKWFTDVILDVNTYGINKVFKFYDDDGALRNTLTVNHNGRKAILYSFDIPFLSRKIIRKSNDSEKFLLHHASYRYRATSDGIDNNLAKFWQGVKLDLDTYGVNKVIKFYDDNRVLKAQLTVNHNGRISKEYSFNIPFISNKLYRESTDNIQFALHKEEYVFDREAELALVWESQHTSFGIGGFKQVKLPTITVASSTDVTLKVLLDNVALPDYNIPATGNVKKSYGFHIVARKFKLLRFRLESSEPFRFYRKDLSIQIRKWNAQEDFQVIRPFGVEDDVTGVQI